MSLYYMWYMMGYDVDEVEPTEQTVRVRHEMLKQIKLSSVKLTKPTPMPAVKPTSLRCAVDHHQPQSPPQSLPHQLPPGLEMQVLRREPKKGAFVCVPHVGNRPP